MKRYLTPIVATCTALAVVAFVFVNGCKKETTDTETTSATDNNICEGEFMRLLPTVNKIAIDEPGVHRLGNGNQVASACPTVTVNTPNQFPLVMTIDYGSGCSDPIDGKIRKGKIRVSMDRQWDSTGCVVTMSLDTFFVGAVQYEGTMSLTRTAPNAFHQVITNGKCTKNTGDPWTILYGSDRTITFTSGSNNSSVAQVITVDGTCNGTDRNGVTYTGTITSPIVRDLTCTWITKGTFDLTPSGKSTRTIDFGNGDCDNKGTIKIDGNTFEFTMN